MLHLPTRTHITPHITNSTETFAELEDDQAYDLLSMDPTSVCPSFEGLTGNESYLLSVFRDHLQSLPSSVSTFFHALPRMLYDIMGSERGRIFYRSTTPGEEYNQHLSWNRSEMLESGEYHSQLLDERVCLLNVIKRVRDQAYPPGMLMIFSVGNVLDGNKWVTFPIHIGSSLRGVVCVPYAQGKLSLHFYECLLALLHRSLEETSLTEIALGFAEREKRSSDALTKVDTREQERHRIASELHDELGQSLTALQLQLSILLDPGLNVEQVERLGQQASSQVGDMLAWIRSLTRSLNPIALEQHGLKTALEIMLSQLCAGAGAEIHSNFDEICEDSLPQPTTLAVYRIVQEATTNAVRYAEAQNISVAITLPKAGWLQVQVKDDGRGFLPDVKNYGTGLNNIYERAAALKGTASVISKPGQGTTITATLPALVPGCADESQQSEIDIAIPLSSSLLFFDK